MTQIILGASFILGSLLFACSSNDKGRSNTNSKEKDVVQIFDSANHLSARFKVNELGKRNGWYMEYYPTGKTKLLLNYSNDFLEGEQKNFYENGSLKSISYYKHGNIDSIQRWYYPSGELKAEYNRILGSRFGAQKEYYQNGVLENVYFMSNCDTCMTSELIFDSSGTLKSKKGNLIYTVSDSKRIKVGGRFRMVSYILTPPSFKFNFDVAIEHRSHSNKLSHRIFDYDNMTKLILVDTSFKRIGEYRVSLKANFDIEQFQPFKKISDTSILLIVCTSR